jgi:hypothetical protein
MDGHEYDDLSLGQIGITFSDELSLRYVHRIVRALIPGLNRLGEGLAGVRSVTAGPPVSGKPEIIDPTMVSWVTIEVYVGLEHAGRDVVTP